MNSNSEAISKNPDSDAESSNKNFRAKVDADTKSKKLQKEAITENSNGTPQTATNDVDITQSFTVTGMFSSHSETAQNEPSPDVKDETGSKKIPFQKLIGQTPVGETFIQKAVEENLSLMGYCAPYWDNFRLQKAPPSSLTSPDSKYQSTEMSRKQLFIIKVWPKIEGFFQEDEDPVVIAHAETVRKNGLLTRLFRFAFDNELDNHRWQFVLEKRIDPGLQGLAEKNNVRQSWAVKALEPVPEYEERLIYTRSFDTHGQSCKYKINQEPGVVSKHKKTFFTEVKASLIDAFEGSNQVENEDQPSREGVLFHRFFKGKEFEFEEAGNQIAWTVSIRTVRAEAVPQKTWFVKSDEKSLQLEVKNSKGVLRSRNPFELNDDGISNLFLAEQVELDRQVVEQSILDFINCVWPRIRNFYLELCVNNDEMGPVIQVARKNGLPTRSLELHFDTLNERNRWKFAFEISRGTSSLSGEDQNEYFKAFYQRWFLNEVQWKLVKCFAQPGVNAITALDSNRHLFDFGKDLEFSSGSAHVIWAVSAQKLKKYPLDKVSPGVWCYGLTDTYLPPPKTEILGKPRETVASSLLSDLLEESDDKDDVTTLSGVSDLDADISFVSNTFTEETVKKQKNKSRSKFKTLASNFVRPVLKRASWLDSTSKFFHRKRSANKTEAKEEKDK